MADYASQVIDAVVGGRHDKEYPLVYFLDDAVAKRGTTREVAENEWRWGNFAHAHELKVPEMFEQLNLGDYGIFTVMQKIDGPRLSDLRGSAYEEALPLFKAEKEKVLRLGINPKDVHERNALVAPDGVYLVDFELWGEEGVITVDPMLEAVINLPFRERFLRTDTRAFA